jgi:hypothetical protein
MQDGTIIRNGTLGGLLFLIPALVRSGDLIQTIVLAAVGAVVSFTVSLGLKKLVEQLQRKARPRD